jgi:hypothetical protein
VSVVPIPKTWAGEFPNDDIINVDLALSEGFRVAIRKMSNTNLLGVNLSKNIKNITSGVSTNQSSKV